MKIYIAAKYAKRYELRPIVEQLRAMGHECTSQWIDNGEESKGQRAAALMDLQDVDRADMLLMIAEPYRSMNTGGGRWVEFGYAFAKGKRIVLVQQGDVFETVFCALPNIFPVASISDALLYISKATENYLVVCRDCEEIKQSSEMHGHYCKECCNSGDIDA